LGQIGGLSELSEQQLPVAHCPWQQRLPLPALEHDGLPSHGTHWPLPLQIGVLGSVHWPLVQHALQAPPQQCWLPEQDSQIPFLGLQVSHCDGSHALARQTLPQTRVFGQHEPLRQVSSAPHVESHVPVPGLQTLHCAGSHGDRQPPTHLPLRQIWPLGQHAPLQQIELGQSELPQHALQTPLQIFGLSDGQPQTPLPSLVALQVAPPQQPPPILQPVLPMSTQVWQQVVPWPHPLLLMLPSGMTVRQ
jgi:hypothetical protein